VHPGFVLCVDYHCIKGPLCPSPLALGSMDSLQYHGNVLMVVVGAQSLSAHDDIRTSSTAGTALFCTVQNELQNPVGC
jgi:hypothetical protein